MKTRITLTIDHDTFERLQEYARRERRSISQTASLILEDWLEKNDDGLRKENHK